MQIIFSQKYRGAELIISDNKSLPVLILLLYKSLLLCFDSTKMIFTSCSDIQQDDTTCVCARNSIADITFYDSNNVITKIESFSANKFPILFTEKTRQMQFKARTSLIKHLKPGQDLPSQPLHNDWMIGIIRLRIFIFFNQNNIKKYFTGGCQFFPVQGNKRFFFTRD